MLKNYLKSYMFLFGILLILTIILSIINYFIPFNSSIFKLIIPVISIIVSTIILGKGTSKKAYLEGIKFTGSYLLLAIVISVITKNPFTIKLVLSYLLILVCGIVGSMIGINLNKGAE